MKAHYGFSSYEIWSSRISESCKKTVSTWKYIVKYISIGQWMILNGRLYIKLLIPDTNIYNNAYAHDMVYTVNNKLIIHYLKIVFPNCSLY